MAVSMTVKEFLDSAGIDYEVLPHPYSSTTKAAAREGHVPAEQLAKSVILEDGDGFLMAVIPGSYQIQLGALSKQLRRKVGLASEGETAEIFRDCELGAIPPVGEAYGMQVAVDDTLAKYPDIYFEAGDHTDLVHIHGGDFQRMMQHAYHGNFSAPTH